MTCRRCLTLLLLIVSWLRNSCADQSWVPAPASPLLRRLGRAEERVKLHEHSRAKALGIRGGGRPHKASTSLDSASLLGGSLTPPKLLASARPLIGWLGIVGALATYVFYPSVASQGLSLATLLEVGVIKLAFFVTGLLATTLHFAADKIGNDSVANSHSSSKLSCAGFLTFRWRYLGIHLLCSFADYLQGAYLYKVYDLRGFSMDRIALLFLSGFISSLFFGLSTGALVDRWGRRSGCIAFAMLHAIQCMAFRTRSFWLLMAGRILSGIATSLLTTSFECWMVTEHHKRGFSSSLLSETFTMYVLGTGAAAVMSGIVAGAAVESGWGLTAPFDVSAGVALVAAVLMRLLWTENYGSEAAAKGGSYVREALRAIAFNSKTRAVGLFQALFEGSMFSWVFMWTPALDTGDIPDLNLGLVFSTLMVAVMAGSSFFRLFTESLPERWSFLACTALTKYTPMLRMTPEKALFLDAVVASAALGMASCNLPAIGLLACFLVFEFCVGIYFSAIGMMRSKYIDDGVRGTVMNIFRIGLNGVVVAMLLGPIGRPWPMSTKKPVVFGICSGLLALSAVTQGGLMLEASKALP